MEIRTVAGRIQSKATLRNICWRAIAPAFAVVTLIVSDLPVDYYKYLPLPARYSSTSWRLNSFGYRFANLDLLTLA
jgi:hypothetical protein